MENDDGSPWHAGEIALQQTVGVVDRMAFVGPRVFMPFMPDQHRRFYSQLPFMVAGVVGEDGYPWVTIVSGKPGFVQALEPKVLEVGASVSETDPAFSAFGEGASIGLLGIELHTRRRNRVNGVIRDYSADGFHVGVLQAFGNCPKYIQLRDYEFVDAGEDVVEVLDVGDSGVRSLIEKADTFFVASYADYDGVRQVDASHRGGKPGFVRVGEDGVVTVPDYSGNMFFNTLGNILVTGKAGLVFPDFETGDVLQLTGDAEIVLGGPEVGEFVGAERLWKVRPARVVLRRGALPMRWVLRGYSPFL